MKSKILIVLMVTVLLMCCFSATASAETNSVTLRIEGITENLYYDTVKIPESATVADVVISADSSSDDINVIGAESFYITEINGEAAGKFGGWDGWSYMVNGMSPSVGIGDYNVKNGDVIVIYYADPFGVGMQYPVIDTAEIANGVIKFTSTDTTYDENFNPTTSVNPVTDMKVVIDETEYVTDEKGAIKIDVSRLSYGEHKISISKVSESGIPLVLRLSPDAAVVIPEPTSDESSGGGFNMLYLIPVLAAVVIAVIAAIISINKKNKAQQ